MVRNKSKEDQRREWLHKTGCVHTGLMRSRSHASIGMESQKPWVLTAGQMLTALHMSSSLLLHPCLRYFDIVEHIFHFTSVSYCQPDIFS
mmetsp:Transcript_13934/g.21507  ORF Transcript_13934/g.21507 Transcript_13934/m.21507 type:complete len:90 (+) Transcript_13934:16-285(+)